MVNIVSDPAPVKARKPRQKPLRTIAVIEPATPDTDGFFAVEITEGKRVDLYLVGPVDASQFGQGLQGFEFEKVSADWSDEGLQAPYHVLLDLNNPEKGSHSCECMGHLSNGHRTRCRHVAGLLALHAGGKLLMGRDARRQPELTYAADDGYSEWAAAVDATVPPEEAPYFDPAEQDFDPPADDLPPTAQTGRASHA
jgi:hypothetical protein